MGVGGPWKWGNNMGGRAGPPQGELGLVDVYHDGL